MYRPLTDESLPSKILYAAVTNSEKILFDYSVEDDLSSVVKDMLAKELKFNTRTSYDYQGHYQVHILAQSRYCFFVISDSGYSRVFAYEFLEELKDNYQSNPSSTKRSLLKQVDKYNQLKSENNIVKIKNHLQEVHGIMLENLERVIEKGTKLEELVHKTDQLEEDAKMFHQDAKAVEKHFCWQKYKYCLLVLMVLLVLGGLVGLMVYLGVFS